MSGNLCVCGHSEAAHGTYYHENAPPGCDHCGCAVFRCKLEINERGELAAEQKEMERGRAEALSEALRLLPQARGWLVVAVMNDGNPAVLMCLPQYADAVCAKELAALAVTIHLSKNFKTGLTQEI